MKLTLARAITDSAERCQVQPLDGDGPIDAPLSPPMIENGTRIRPGMIVALDRGTTPPMIRYRFETRAVEALTDDRMTILGRTFRFADARPEDDRVTPLRAGDTVIFRMRGASDEIDVIDTVQDGRPRHPEFLEAEFPRIEAIYRDLASA